MPETHSDLDLIQTTDLVEELLARTDAGLFFMLTADHPSKQSLVIGKHVSSTLKRDSVQVRRALNAFSDAGIEFLEKFSGLLLGPDTSDAVMCVYNALQNLSKQLHARQEESGNA